MHPHKKLLWNTIRNLEVVVVGTQGAPLAADCSTNQVQTVPACPQVDRRSSASVNEKPPDCRRRCSIAVSASRCYEWDLCHTEDSPQARREGVFVAAPQAWNRQHVAFHSCIQALFENIFVLGGIQCLISRPLHTAFTHKLFRFYRFFNVPDIVVRSRSICRRRSKSIVVFVFVFGRSFRIRHENSPKAPPSGEISMTSYPTCNKTSLSRKPRISDKSYYGTL